MSASAPLVVRHCRAGFGTTVVAVAGEIDMATYPDLDHGLRSAIRQPSARLVILDLRGVTFIGVCAIPVLVRASETAVEFEILFRLVVPSTSIGRVLQFCLPQRDFDLCTTLREAFELSTAH